MQHVDPIKNTREQNIILLVLGTMIAIGPLSIDMYLPSFEAIADDFQISKSYVGISLTSYFIGIALGQLVYGPIMDKYGRKIPLLVGLIIYIISALSCYYSPDIMWLIVSRFFLAIGASAGMVAAKAVVRDIFPPEEVSRAISFLMLIMGSAPIIAPTLSGFVLAHYSWEMIFMFLAIFAALMFLSVLFFLPESITPDKTVELRFKQVFFKYKGIMQDKVFLSFSLAGSLTIGAMFAYISNAPILFMDRFHFTEAQFGWMFGLNASGLILGSQLNRFILKRVRTFELTYLISYILLALGVILLINAIWFNSFYITVISLFFILFLLGFQNPNTTALSLYPFTKRAGRASALVGCLKMCLGAITSYVISLFTGVSLLPMALTILVCLVFSNLLLVRFKLKEHKAMELINPE